MLIITRRLGESFFIGDEIEVVVLEVGSSIRLGIDAPASVEILRTELVPDELETAAKHSPEDAVVRIRERICRR